MRALKHRTHDNEHALHERERSSYKLDARNAHYGWNDTSSLFGSLGQTTVLYQQSRGWEPTNRCNSVTRILHRLRNFVDDIYKTLRI